MIHGIGTDLLDAGRVRDGLARFGDRYADRLLAPAEQAGYRASADPARFLAKSFAAKEAFAKAAGTGLRAPVTLANIAVLRDGQGKPHFACAPELTDWLRTRGIAAHHVSLSDEGDFILAFVILETT
ncbi:holo-ACP synthase [Betaproteobacteria bacterium SCN1]|jgi:holo-[acyl-carrier protein] synthase|nr:holo-ACP synthase [Betaproteobacteria bacterium SCN1]MBN8759280.1 holo-ACP synthase [Thiobacillus sp.]ODU90229.1 MAG: holo-[acyl-carrier-protein] synthase [Thiobacillus sp. SCN 65-179]OJW38334.1 MAG: holo-[acyl-carrier-protein] synthase [Thiobacillus sp. 65-69]